MTETVGVTFDVDALRTKYAEERERRLRPDGIAQYVETTGAFARFAEELSLPRMPPAAGTPAPPETCGRFPRGLSSPHPRSARGPIRGRRVC